MQFWLERWASPLATILLVTDNEGTLRGLDFDDNEARTHRLLRLHYGDYTLTDRAAPREITGALSAYFDGEMHALDDLRTATGGTPFQRAVWKALRAIPAGDTVTYSAIAETIGRPSACRAVGAANGANPIAIVVPCHRVIGADRSLTGFAGGLSRKQWLLDHERRHKHHASREHEPASESLFALRA